MNTCKACGADFADEDEFCKKCGARPENLADLPPPEKAVGWGWFAYIPCAFLIYLTVYLSGELKRLDFPWHIKWIQEVLGILAVIWVWKKK
jgi:hypothetical protein